MEISKKIEEFKKKSRNLGLKVTPQRIAVYRAILSRRDHPSAEELYEELKGKIEGISLTTVYRTLSSLERVGLVQRVPTLKDKVRYDARVEPHSHFICLNCGRIYDIDVLPNVDEERVKPIGKPLNCTAVCYGICRECSVEEV